MITVGCAALNQTPLDLQGNVENIRQAIVEANNRGVQLLLLPELAISGYGCEDAFYSSELVAACLECLRTLLPETSGMAVSIGLPLLVGGQLYNAQAFCLDGKCVGFVCKESLAGTEVYYEPRWFSPWPPGRVSSVDFGGITVPVGDLLFDLNRKGRDPIRVGYEICEDAWVIPRRGERYRELLPEILLNPSASHFALGKPTRRRELIDQGAEDLAGCYLYCNLVGNESGRIIYDGHTAIALRGGSFWEGERFTFSRFSLLAQSLFFGARPVKPTDPRIVSGELPAARRRFEEAHSVESGNQWEDDRFEEFTRSAALGLFDYLRKSGAQGFVVSVSGGVDSAATIILASLALTIPFTELGKGGIRKRLESIKGIGDLGNAEELVNALVCGVYQRTAQSSKRTEEAAEQITREVGAEFLTIDVESLVAGYRQVVSDRFGELNWEQHGIALQNLQARVRSPGVWLMANLRSALLLNTSNRSECSVGYTTMDGDSSGGVSPLAGIDKHFLREWLRWMETRGPKGVGAFPGLGLINSQAPTAELLPPQYAQTDEKDLMPYDLLQQIEALFLVEKLGRDQIVAGLISSGRLESESELRGRVEQFLRLWRISQWKRERTAPAFHLDRYSVDPKGWCRYPILSGRFFEGQ